MHAQPTMASIFFISAYQTLSPFYMGGGIIQSPETTLSRQQKMSWHVGMCILPRTALPLPFKQIHFLYLELMLPLLSAQLIIWSNTYTATLYISPNLGNGARTTYGAWLCIQQTIEKDVQTNY